MPNASFIRWSAFGLFLLLTISAAWANIKVTHKPVEVAHKSFDHNDPPKDLLGDKKETAVTASEFDLQIGLSIAPGTKRKIRSGKWQESMVVEGVNLVLGLKITVWLPDDANEKLKAHEEGHRQMAEKIYAERADKAARAAAALIDGRRLTAEADTADGLDKAFEETVGEANKKVYHAYLSQTADASARAGDIYDEITHHGSRGDIDEKTAAAQAFDRLVEEAKNPPATSPATRPIGKAGTTQPGGARLEKGPLQMTPK